LFRDSSDGEASQSDDSSGAEPSMETEEASEMETVGSVGGSTVVGNQERTVFLKKRSECQLLKTKTIAIMRERAIMDFLFRQVCRLIRAWSKSRTSGMPRIS